ncbi:MAG: hypothetical protein EAZ57_08320 [Cytophagales bacterium]|nr:MAG: hypothetical protein EAZ67_05860 [Cytophagales bacterium]TAF60152.1 MAG: hypothetical protein EAZ57_08320 [Cytophagales bacterium]
MLFTVPKDPPYLRLLAKLIPDLVSLVGVFLWGWSFFVIMYLFWWEILFESLGARVGAYIWHKRGWISNSQYTLAKRSFATLLFMYSVYWVFVVVGVGFLSNAGTDGFIETLQVLFFGDHYFSLMLCCLFLFEVGALIKAQKEAEANPPVPVDVDITFKERVGKEESETNTVMPRSAIVMHLTLIFGLMVSFLPRQLPDSFHQYFELVHARPDVAFLCVFIAIKSIPTFYDYFKE